MKAQTYYRCENCGKIAAREAGKQLASCLDCGSGNLQILVPVDSEAKADPLSGRKKVALAALIGFAGVASIAVFLLFGRLLQGYMVFDAEREATEKAHERLTTEIQAQEAALASLSKKASEELAQASANARQIEASTSSAKAEMAEAEKALHRARLTLSNETARIAGVQAELVGLEDERGRLRKKVDALTAEEAQLSAAVDAAVSRTNRLAFEVAAAEKAQTSVSADLAKALTALDTANTARDKTREQAEAQVARVTSLAARKEALEADIRDKEKTQAVLDAAIAELKKQNAAALVEATRARAALDTLNVARDKAREEADAQSARAARLKAGLVALEKDKADAEKTKGLLGK